MYMVNEIDDSEFHALLREKQHKEMIAAIDKLVLNIDKLSNEPILKAIQKNQEITSQIISKVQDITPNVEVHTDQEEVIQEISNLTAELKQGISQLQESIVPRPTEWTLKIKKRDSSGYIEEATLKSNQYAKVNSSL